LTKLRLETERAIAEQLMQPARAVCYRSQQCFANEINNAFGDSRSGRSAPEPHAIVSISFSHALAIAVVTFDRLRWLAQGKLYGTRR
jgi:hypothetical protein